MIPLTTVTKNLSGLVSRVRSLVLDWHGERFESERVIQALNDAAVDVSVDHGLCCDQVTVRLFQGLLGYDVMLKVAGERLYGPSIREFAGIERVFFDGTDVVKAGGVDEFFKVKDMRWTPDFSEFGSFILFTPPSVAGDVTGSGGNLTVTYKGYPEPMVELTDRPDSGLPVCDEALCLKAAAELLLEGNLEDFQKALEFDRLYRVEASRVRGGLNRKGYVMEMVPL